MSTSCDDSGCDGPTDRCRPCDSLLRPTRYLPSGLHRVAFGRAQVADRVRHRHLVDHFPRAELPLGDRAVDEERRVGEAVRAELRVQRPEADRHLRVLDRLVLQHRDAVLVAREVLVADRRLDLLEVEDGRDALAACPSRRSTCRRATRPRRAATCRRASGRRCPAPSSDRAPSRRRSCRPCRPRSPSRPPSSPPPRCSRGRAATR